MLHQQSVWYGIVGFTVHSTHYRSFPGWFYGYPTNSWRTMVSRPGQGPIPPLTVTEINSTASVLCSQM